MKENLQKKREKKALKLCSDSGINLSTERLQALSTTDHHNDELFDSSDLQPAEQWEDDTIAIQATTTEEEDKDIRITEDGRLIG